MTGSRQIKNTFFPGEITCDAGFSAREAMHHALQTIMDKIRVEISDCL
jgi:hypothetical protein